MWFSPKCVIDRDQKIAIDQAMAWLMDRLGVSIILDGQVTTPSREYFPNVFTRRIADLSDLFDRVCVYMRLDPDAIGVRFVDAEKALQNVGGDAWVHNEGSTAAGTYETFEQKQIITIMVGSEMDQTSVIATMAHELAHVHLIGGKHVDTYVDDHEPVTDLATVFFGLGIFNANSVCKYNQSGGGWSTNRLGYLSEVEFGYALALYAYLRNESKPNWIRYLRGNIKDVMRKSLKYLVKTGDCEIELSKPGAYAHIPKLDIVHEDEEEGEAYPDTKGWGRGK